MKILIDGDACPVKESVYRLADTADLPVILVTSLSHYSHQDLPSHVETIYVDEGADSADYRLLSLVTAGDLVITQDYGLASLVLPKGVRVLHHLGTEYTSATIDQLLESRYFSAKMRQAGKRTKGPKKFTKEDTARFELALKQIIES